MRRFLLFSVLVGLLAVPAADATLARTTGAVYVQFAGGAGAARIRYRGNLLGKVRRGRILATRNVMLNGCERRRLLTPTARECRGRRLTFRTPQFGRWNLRLRGRGINASGFVRGCMVLNGVDSGDPGRFRVGWNGLLHRWPRASTRYRLGAGC